MKPLLILFFILSSFCASAQLDSCNIFLYGNHLAVGISQIGAFGSTCDAPITDSSRPTQFYHNGQMYHNPCDPANPYASRNLSIGIIADPDKDGWNNGAPDFFGDYFEPGYPQEGWTISVNDLEVSAFSPGLTTKDSIGFSSPLLMGSNTVFVNSGIFISGIWLGELDVDSQHKVEITQVITLDTSDLYVTCEIILKNIGIDTLKRIYYERTLDPDNDQTISGDYTTRNVVTWQLPNPQNRVAMSTWGTHYTKAFLALGTVDCRAKAFISTSGLLSTSHSSSIYAHTASDARYDSLTSDVGVGIVFSLDSLAPNDSISFSYAYVLEEPELDTALSYHANWAAGGDTIKHKSRDTTNVCRNGIVPVSILSIGYNNWSWSSLTGNTIIPLSQTLVDIVMDNSPAVIQAIGNSSPCSTLRDTLTIVLNPVPPDTPAITINGPLFSRTGTNTTFIGTVSKITKPYFIIWKNKGSSLGITNTPKFSYKKDIGIDTIIATLVTTGVGCSDTAYSNTWIVLDPSHLGIPQPAAAQEIKLYPNPTTNEINISGLNAGDNIQLYNMMGQKLLQLKATSDNTILNLNKYMPGIYVIKVLDNGGNTITNLPFQKL